MAAMTPPVTRKTTGRTSTTTTAMMMGPSSTSLLLPLVGPGLYFHEGADGQGLDGDGRAGRPVVAEGGDVGLVHRRVVTHVGEEHGGLGHVLQAGVLGGELGGEVAKRLFELGLQPALDKLAFADADLAGNNQPVAGADDRRVRTNGSRRVAHRVVVPLFVGQSCG